MNTPTTIVWTAKKGTVNFGLGETYFAGSIEGPSTKYVVRLEYVWIDGIRNAFWGACSVNGSICNVIGLFSLLCDAKEACE